MQTQKPKQLFDPEKCLSLVTRSDGFKAYFASILEGKESDQTLNKFRTIRTMRCSSSNGNSARKINTTIEGRSKQIFLHRADSFISSESKSLKSSEDTKHMRSGVAITPSRQNRLNPAAMLPLNRTSISQESSSNPQNP